MNVIIEHIHHTNWHKNKLNIKYDIYEYLNKMDGKKNTLFHKLVKENQMLALRLILEYASEMGFIDTIGFGLKNNENKTCFELAVELKNSEAIYLLNHYERTEKSLNLHLIKYPFKLEYLDFELNIRNFQAKDKQSIYESNMITNLIFEGGGVKGIAHVSALQESVKKGILNLTNIKRIGGTSAGAIIAVLLGVGFSLDELEKILNEFNFENLLDSNSDSTKKKDEIKKRFLSLKKGFKNATENFGLGHVIDLLFSVWQCSEKEPEDTKIGFFPGDFFSKLD